MLKIRWLTINRWGTSYNTSKIPCDIKLQINYETIIRMLALKFN